jgi:hypothetical protein
MTFEEAIKIVKRRYGLLASYIDARTGKMMTVIKAEPELKAIPALERVAWTEYGISLLASDVIELAVGNVTIKELVQRKNPEIFAAAIALGSQGGRAIAERGPDYFRQLQARRKERKGGRPKSSRSVSENWRKRP